MSGVWLLLESSGSFGGRESIDIDLDYCWAEAGVGWIWICAGGQAVSASSGGEACEGVLVYGGASCTEWKINSAMVSFNPNCYVEVGKEGVDAKVKALSMYRGMMRPYPHPRSAEVYRGPCGVSWRAVGLDVC